MDKVIQEITPRGSISYEYDAIGRRTTMTVAGQQSANYTYDANSQLTSVVGAGLVPAQIAYDVIGRRTSLTLPNGVTTNYAYDNASRLLNLEHLNPLNQILEKISYAYDSNGNRTSMNRLNVTPTLPDPATNITYNSANQMLTYNDKNTTYDENGNMTSIINTCGITTYTWDARNRLVGINGFDALCAMLSASFKYDAIGRRIEKTVYGKTIQYVYDGWDIVQEIEGGQVTVNYIRTLNIDEPLARVKANGTVRYYQQDALGSVIALTDETGVVKTQYNYDPFGSTEITGEQSDNPFQFAGRENDGTGLLYERNRYYSFELQRYISEDPIRLAGGDINFYVRVENSPLNWVDPWGLIWGTVDHDYYGGSNWLRWYLNRWRDQIGKGLDPTMPGSDPNEYVGLKRDIIQEWQPDPNNPCRDKEYPIGTRRRITQTYIKHINPGPTDALVNAPEAPFYYQWSPWVNSPTYGNYPNTRYENLYYWRQRR